MDFKVNNLYPYRLKSCTTIPEIDTALEFYEQKLELQELLTQTDLHNIEELVYKLKLKRNELEASEVCYPKLLDDLSPARVRRKDAVIELVKLIPDMFCHKDTELWAGSDHPSIVRMFQIYLGALQEHGISWRSKIMYNEVVKFHNCGTKDEMIIYLLHEVIVSGLHVPAQITKQINPLIKLTRHLKADQRMPVILPDLDVETKAVFHEYLY